MFCLIQTTALAKTEMKHLLIIPEKLKSMNIGSGGQQKQTLYLSAQLRLSWKDKCHSKVKSHNEFWRNFADQPNLPHQIKGHNGEYYYYHYYLLCKVAKPYEKEITGTNHRGAAPDLYSDVIYFKDLFTEATQNYYE